MTPKKPLLKVAAIAFVYGAASPNSLAELPMIQEKEWLGYFIGIEEKSFKFGITPSGESWVDILSKKGEPISRKLKVMVDFQVEQVMPDGKFSNCAILPESLESTQLPGVDHKQTVIRGKVKGDASFEITVEKGRGGVLMGGRILEPGTLTANPLRFSIIVKIPNVYEDREQGGDKKEMKKREEELKDDRVQLTTAAQKKVKLSAVEPVDAGSPEINGAGIKGVEITLSPYQGKSIELAASPNSSMTLSNKAKGPLHGGFWVTWTADSAKDPNGAARMNIAIR